jgi:hypothetical protein
MFTAVSETSFLFPGESDRLNILHTRYVSTLLLLAYLLYEQEKLSLPFSTRVTPCFPQEFPLEKPHKLMLLRSGVVGSTKRLLGIPSIGCERQILHCTSFFLSAIALLCPIKKASFSTKFSRSRSIMEILTSAKILTNVIVLL